MTSDKVNLLDFLVFLLRWRRFILFFTGAIILIAIIASLITPAQYMAKATIFPSQEQQLDISSFISSKLAGLPGVAGFAAQMGSLPGEIYLTILRSRSMSETVIDTFQLRKKWRMERASPEEVIRVLRSCTSFQYDLRDGTVVIEVTSKDPQQAAYMVNFYARQLDRRNQELKSQKAGHDKTFIGERLEDARSRMAVLEDSMRSFQERTGILNVEEQVKATIQTAAELEALRLTTELELSQAREMMEPDNPFIQELERKLNGIRTQMRQLVDRHQKSAEDKLLPTLKDAPAYGITYLKLLRDITVQELLYQFLVQQYEQARIVEVRNTPTMQAIDWAIPPIQRSWPKRGIMVIVAGTAAFVFATACALIIEGFRTANNQPEHPQHARVMALKRTLWRRED
jgi:uncharacterized protein involved in exopolysaccharide biosynthesis